MKKLDRKIQIHEPVKNREVNGEESITYQLLVELRARKMERLGKERYEQDRETATNVTRWITRYRKGIKASHILIFDGITYDITKVREIDRKGFLEIETEEKQTLN